MSFTTRFAYSLVLALFLGASERPLVEFIAHRGASYDAPENTLAAFRLGWEQNADANELDIHLTKDGQIVVIHDDSTKRTANLNRKVAAQTLEELRTLDAGLWQGNQWRGEKIPTLAESLVTIPMGKRVFIEIKCGPEVLPELERVLEASGKKPEQLVIIGFDYETMKKAKTRFPHLPIYWLVSPKKESQGLHPPVKELIEMAKSAQLDGLNLSFKFAIDAPFVARVKESGLKLYVWTVDDPLVAEKLVAMGIDGITTNRPGWLREQLSNST